MFYFKLMISSHLSSLFLKPFGPVMEVYCILYFNIKHDGQICHLRRSNECFVVTEKCTITPDQGVGELAYFLGVLTQHVGPQGSPRLSSYHGFSK